MQERGKGKTKARKNRKNIRTSKTFFSSFDYFSSFVCFGRFACFISKIGKRLGQMTKKIVANVNKAILKLLSGIVLLAAFLVGCSKPSFVLEHGYEAKQMQRGNLETTYVFCKQCIDYTKINN